MRTLKDVTGVLLALAAATWSFGQETWDRNHEDCDKLGNSGALCAGLGFYYRLDEPSDYPRVSESGGGRLMECPGTDVGTSTTSKWGLPRSASFDGTPGSGFLIAGGGAFGSGIWTLAVWVYPTSATVTSTILSTMSGNNGKQGLALDLYYTGSALNARGRSYMQDTDTILTVQNNTNITANAWHLIVFQSGHSTIRKLYSTNALKVSVDGGAFTSTTWTNAPRTNPTGNLVIGKSVGDIDKKSGACSSNGGGFTGHLQGLALYGRALTAADIALLYFGGNGRDFPFSN